MTDPSLGAGQPRLSGEPAWPPATPRAAAPATVQAAVIVTWLCCALTTLVTMVFLAGSAFVGSVILPSFERADRVQIVLVVVGTAVASVLASALASWFAWNVGRRRSWARIALAACCAVAVTVSLGAPGPHTFLMLPGSVAVLVLLFLPESNAWFRPSPSAAAARASWSNAPHE